MTNPIPISLYFLLIGCVIFCISQLLKATQNSTLVLILFCIWIAITTNLGLQDFFLDTQSMPPRFILLVAPGIVLSLYILLSKRSKNFVDRIDIKYLTLLHAVRIPVEIMLHQMYIQKLVPQTMTYEGYNFDIVSGVLALAIFVWVYVLKKYSKSILIVFNLIGLVLLLTILVLAILSLKSPLQKFGFDQPNVGVTYFPFIWLPSIIVPSVLFAHLITLKKLLSKTTHV
jgi:hypothetical protein